MTEQHAWDAIPDAHRVLCWLEVNAPHVGARYVQLDAAEFEGVELEGMALEGLVEPGAVLRIELPPQTVIFSRDVADTGCWETTLLPEQSGAVTDHPRPSHVIYFQDRIEVHRYWTPDAEAPEIVASLKWDDPDLLDKVLKAACSDMLADWEEVGDD